MAFNINYNNQSETFAQIETMIETNPYSSVAAEKAISYLSYYGNNKLFFRVIDWENEYLSINNIDKTTYRNILTTNNNEPLVNAIGSNNVDLVKYLVANGVNPNTPNDVHLGSFVGIAAFDGHYEMLVYLVDTLGLNHRLDNDSAFISACGKGYLSCAKFLFQKGVDIIAKNNEALLDACENEHIEVIKFLLDNGAIAPSTSKPMKKIGNYFSVEIKMRAPEELNLQNILNKVAGSGNIEILKLFVEKGISLGLYSKCISWAIAHDKKQMMYYLEENGVDITKDDGFLIKHVQSIENFDLLKYFIDKGLPDSYLQKYQTKDIERFVFSYKLDKNIPDKQKNVKKIKI